MAKNKLIISISGTPGSGKSTVAKMLCKKLKATRLYVGGIRRQLAKSKGLTLAELNQYALTHPETDIDVDKKAAKQARLLAKSQIVIIEGRVMFHFLPESYKIFIKVNLAEAAKRIWPDLQNKKLSQQRNEAKINSLAELKKSLKARMANDKIRYKKYYKLDFTKNSNYDLIIDTTRITARQAADKINQRLQQLIK